MREVEQVDVQAEVIVPPCEVTLGPEITPLLTIHMRVHQQRPDQALVTRMELGGHWVEFGSPAEPEEAGDE